MNIDIRVILDRVLQVLLVVHHIELAVVSMFDVFPLAHLRAAFTNSEQPLLTNIVRPARRALQAAAGCL